MKKRMIKYLLSKFKAYRELKKENQKLKNDIRHIVLEDPEGAWLKWMYKFNYETEDLLWAGSIENYPVFTAWSQYCKKPIDNEENKVMFDGDAKTKFGME